MNDAQRAKAFYEAKRRYIPFLSAVLWQLAGDRDLFMDAMYWALFGVWRNAEKLQGKRPWKTLYHIALTANTTAWKHRKQKGQNLPAAAAADDTERHRQLRQSFAVIVREALAELPVRTSQVVVMHYVERKSVWDIAHTLGCPWTAVQSTVDRSVQLLKQKVSEKQGLVA